MIELKNVSKEYKIPRGRLKFSDFYALNNISTIFKNNIVNGITGSSGSGKTTLANVITGYDTDYSGEIFYNGKKEKNPKFIRYVFQDPYIAMNPVKNVEWHIKTAASINGINMEKATEKLELAGMDYNNYKNRYANSLSGGELQKLAFAISIIPEPDFIVLDEAFSMMDSITLFQTLNFLKELKNKISIIYIDHDINRVSFVSDYFYIIDHGQIIEEGYTEKIMECPENDYTKELIKYSPDYKKRI
ncbi:ATP-binding cassette domain-containing protein [Ferroplasma sp.]|uniref:ABC transporter ATP-binding protein n=1 Tax=Ferroplasma sp. TaxID=2591003 RepID=UPI00307E58F7